MTDAFGKKRHFQDPEPNAGLSRTVGDRGFDKTNDNFRYTRNDYALQKFQKLHPSGNVLETPPLNNSIVHTALLRDKMVWTSFPLKERMASTTMGLLTCKSKQTFVDSITTAKPAPNQKELSEAKNKVFKITINETSQLELDPNLMHPFVKMHIVDLQSGNYVQKSGQKSVVTLDEKITLIDNKMNCTQKDLDYIPPFATNCCDLRIAGNARARWNYSIYLNEDANYLFNERTVILFEILDYNKDLLKENSTKLDHLNNYRVAWGYLRLSGLAKNYFGNSKIQLYKYKFEPSLLNVKYLRTTYPKIPFVYYEFIWRDKKFYDSYLSLQINAADRPEERRVTTSAENIFQVEEDLEDVVMNMTKFKQKEREVKDDEDDPEFLKKQKELLKIRRLPDSNCRVPNELLYRFQSASLGCFRLSFSPNGKYLAAACIYENSKSIIKIFNVESGELKYTIRAHKNLIHDIDWNMTSQFLVTSSSDFTAKVWKIPNIESSDEIEEEDSERLMLVCTLSHSSYVYSAKFYQDRDESRLVIITACFDSKIRAWKVSMNNGNYKLDFCSDSIITKDSGDKPDDFINLLEHRHPNSLRIDEERLYVGDSLGLIHLYDIRLRHEKITVERMPYRVENNEIQGDPINNISLLTHEKKKLVVHSRDNCIRIIDYSNSSATKVTTRFFGSKSTKYPIRSTSSPDAQYVLSGSEDGKPYLWDITIEEQIDISNLGVSLLGPITDVAWNSEYHMVAFSGFGDEYPILVFCSKTQETEELNKLIDRMKSIDDSKKEGEGDETPRQYPYQNRRLDGDENVRDDDENVRSAYTSKGRFL